MNKNPNISYLDVLLNIAENDPKMALVFVSSDISFAREELEEMRKKLREHDAEFDILKTLAEHREPCPVCGGMNGEHVTVGGTVQQEPMTVEDWAELHEFVFNKTLAETHRIIARARARLNK